MKHANTWAELRYHNCLENRTITRVLLTAAGVDMKGAEKFVHAGNWNLTVRAPDNIQLEYWLL